MFDLERLQKQSGIIGSSLGIRQVLEMIMQISPVDISVLVTGESGTGKEVVAKAIHKFSKRKNEEMVVVNCGAIPEGIIESELFGHKKGSFPITEKQSKRILTLPINQYLKENEIMSAFLNQYYNFQQTNLLSLR